MPTVELVKGDVCKLFFYLKEEDPFTGQLSSLDLSNVSSIYFRMRREGESTLSVEGTCPVYSASEGVCYYPFSSVDLSRTGTYKGEVEVVYPYQRITFRDLVIIVHEELG